MAFPGSEGAFAIGDNVGERIDAFFGLGNRGHWTTVNFIPSTVTTLFGVWCGYLMAALGTVPDFFTALTLAAQGERQRIFGRAAWAGC